jgi:hypothetical protein
VRGLPAYGVQRRANSLGVLRKRATGAAASSLLNGLVTYWKLDNLTWADSVGSANLANNGVTVGTPKLGAGSAEFDGTNYLSLVSNPAVQMGDIDFTITCWALLDTLTSSVAIVSKGNVTDEYWLGFSGAATNFRFYVNNNALTATAPVSASTWYFLTAWHEAAANTIYLQVNNGTPVSLTTSSTPTIGTTDFNIGADPIPRLFDGRIDEVGIWKRVLTLSEISDLYNSGSGLSYPF